MGSGSTGEACIKKNRLFLGSEIDADYFQGAKARIENATNQGNLF